MKRTFKLIVEIEDGMLSARNESDAFAPGEAGVIFGKMAQISLDMKNYFNMLGGDTAAAFNSGYLEGVTTVSPDGSFIGSQRMAR